jgi:hypothetical protein
MTRPRSSPVTSPNAFSIAFPSSDRAFHFRKRRHSPRRDLIVVHAECTARRDELLTRHDNMTLCARWPDYTIGVAIDRGSFGAIWFDPALPFP